MIPDIVPELSVEQLIVALNKKLTIECTKVQPTKPPVAILAAEIDALEKRVKDILHGVTCLKNSFRLVNRLPPEIIGLCAAFVSHTGPKPIVSLTHVCRYWCGAIISSCGSWTSIDSHWKELVPLFLERSGAGPLTANISVQDIQQDKDFIQALLPHVPRISHLSLCGYRFIGDLKRILPKFFASPMPNLASLELEQKKESTNLFPSKGVPTPQLFRDVSKLKSLHLTRIPLYPVQHNIEPLVELTLVGYKFPFHEFIGFLGSNPNLKILDLQDVSFAGIPVLDAPERLVSFPRLQRLALSCEDATDTRALLSCLSLPHGINIEVYLNVWGWYSLASFLPCPSTHIKDLLAPITTIEYLPPTGVLHLSGKNGSISFHDHEPQRGVYEELDLFATPCPVCWNDYRRWKPSSFPIAVLSPNSCLHWRTSHCYARRSKPSRSSIVR